MSEPEEGPLMAHSHRSGQPSSRSPARPRSNGGGTRRRDSPPQRGRARRRSSSRSHSRSRRGRSRSRSRRQPSRRSRSPRRSRSATTPQRSPCSPPLLPPAEAPQRAATQQQQQPQQQQQQDEANKRQPLVIKLRPQTHPQPDGTAAAAAAAAVAPAPAGAHHQESMQQQEHAMQQPHQQRFVQPQQQHPQQHQPQHQQQHQQQQQQQHSQAPIMAAAVHDLVNNGSSHCVAALRELHLAAHVFCQQKEQLQQEHAQRPVWRALEPCGQLHAGPLQLSHAMSSLQPPQTPDSVIVVDGNHRCLSLRQAHAEERMTQERAAALQTAMRAQQATVCSMLGRLRRDVACLLAAKSAALRSAVCVDSRWLWTSSVCAGAPLEPPLMCWAEVQQRVANSPWAASPVLVGLQQMMPAHGQWWPSGAPTTAAAVMQSLEQASCAQAAIERGLPPANSVCQLLPPFDDSAHIFQLLGGAGGARWSLADLRSHLAAGTLDMLQLVQHAADPQQHLVWAVDLAMLHVVDDAYAARQDAARLQQQQQQRLQQAARSTAHAAAASSHPGRPRANPMALQLQRQQQHQHQQLQHQGSSSAQAAPLRQQQAPPRQSLQQQQAQLASPQPPAVQPKPEQGRQNGSSPRAAHPPAAVAAGEQPHKQAAALPLPAPSPPKPLAPLIITPRRALRLLHHCVSPEPERFGARPNPRPDPANRDALARVHPWPPAPRDAADKADEAAWLRELCGSGECRAAADAEPAGQPPAAAAAAAAKADLLSPEHLPLRPAARKPHAAGGSECDDSKQQQQQPVGASDAASPPANAQPRGRQRRASHGLDSLDPADAAAVREAMRALHSSTRRRASAATKSPTSPVADQGQASRKRKQLESSAAAAAGGGSTDDQEQQRASPSSGSIATSLASAARSKKQQEHEHAEAAAPAAAAGAAKKRRQAKAGGAPAAPGCARALDVAGIRQAAAATKRPGFSVSLVQALQRQQRLLDPATAAAAAGVADGALDDDDDTQVAFGLPASMLRLDQPTAAAGLSVAGGRSTTGGAAAASTGGRRKAARSGSLLADAAGYEPGGAAGGGGASSKLGKRLVLQRSGVHGYGLFAGEAIEAGEMVIEYIGDLCRPVLGDVLEARYEAQGQDSSYLFRIEREWTVDATRRGGRARFINHSCGPNCYARQQKLDGVTRIVICAKRAIEPGEELAYDYKFEYEEGERRVPCACGARECRKFMN